MSEYIKRLREKRANTWEQMKTLLDTAATEGRDLTAEEQETYDRQNRELDDLADLVRRMEDDEKRAKDTEEAFDRLMERPAERGAETPQQRSEAEEVRAFVMGEKRSLEVRPVPGEDVRDLVKGTPTAGGNTVPTSFYGQLVEHMIEVSAVLSAGPTILRTDSGENIEVPTTTSHSTAEIVAEAGAIPESHPAFAKRSLGAYKYGVLLQASYELLSDTGVNLLGYLARQAGRALGNAFGAHLISGSGSGQPTGILTTATAGKTGADGVAGKFTAEDLIDLFYSVIGPYRNASSAGWLMGDTALANARKLRENGSTGAFLWQPALTQGAPDLILGKPVHTDPFMPDVAAGAESVLFGDISAYFVRLAGGVRFERSDDYAFNTDMVTFRALIRGDGLLVDQTGAVKTFTGGSASA